MNTIIAHSEVVDIYEKVSAGNRIDENYARRLFQTRYFNVYVVIVNNA